MTHFSQLPRWCFARRPQFARPEPPQRTAPELGRDVPLSVERDFEGGFCEWGFSKRPGFLCLDMILMLLIKPKLRGPRGQQNERGRRTLLFLLLS